MAKSNVNTTKSMSTPATPSESRLKEWNAKVDKLCSKWGCKKATFSVPKSLQSVHGTYIPVGLNFEYLHFPVDGENYNLPEPMMHILRRSIGLSQAENARDELIKQGVLKEDV